MIADAKCQNLEHAVEHYLLSFTVSPSGNWLSWAIADVNGNDAICIYFKKSNIANPLCIKRVMRLQHIKLASSPCGNYLSIFSSNLTEILDTSTFSTVYKTNNRIIGISSINKAYFIANNNLYEVSLSQTCSTVSLKAEGVLTASVNDTTCFIKRSPCKTFQVYLDGITRELVEPICNSLVSVQLKAGSEGEHFLFALGEVNEEKIICAFRISAYESVISLKINLENQINIDAEIIDWWPWEKNSLLIQIDNSLFILNFNEVVLEKICNPSWEIDQVSTNLELLQITITFRVDGRFGIALLEKKDGVWESSYIGDCGSTGALMFGNKGGVVYCAPNTPSHVPVPIIQIKPYKKRKVDYLCQLSERCITRRYKELIDNNVTKLTVFIPSYFKPTILGRQPNFFQHLIFNLAFNISREFNTELFKWNFNPSKSPLKFEEGYKKLAFDLSYFIEQCKVKNIVIVSGSLGSSLVMNALSQQKVMANVMVSPVYDPTKFITKSKSRKFNSFELGQLVNTPTLIHHGLSDELSPSSDSSNFTLTMQEHSYVRLNQYLQQPHIFNDPSVWKRVFACTSSFLRGIENEPI